MASQGQYTESRRVLKGYRTYRHNSGTGLTRSGVAVLAAIKRVKIQSVSIDDLASRSGYSRKSVTRAVAELETLGYIRVRRCHGRENEYEVLTRAVQ